MSVRTPLARWLVCVVFCLLGACQPEAGAPTRIVVVVSAEAALAAQLDEIEVETDRGIENIPVEGAAGLPLSFVILPHGAPQRSVELRAKSNGTRLIERAAKLRFRQGHTLLWRVFFSSECIAKPCEGGETCGNCGGCVPEEVAPESLEVVAADDDGLRDDQAPVCESSEDGGGLPDGDGSPDGEQPDGDMADGGDPQGDGDGDGDGSPDGDAGRPQSDAGDVAPGAGERLSIHAPAAVAAQGGALTSVRFEVRVTREPGETGPVPVELSTSAGQLRAGDCTSAAPSSITGDVLELCIEHTRSNSKRSSPVTLSATSGEVSAQHELDFRMPALDVKGGQEFACALLEDSSLQCWGTTVDGRVPKLNAFWREIQPVPYAVANATGVSELELGPAFACTIDTTGGARCWGWNAHGQLGRVADWWSASWSPVVGLSTDVTAIGTGTYHACAVQSGSVYCWGRNEFGQLGKAASSSDSPPGLVGSLGNVIDVAAGQDHSCAIVAEVGAQAGEVHCWGRNHAGQLGDGTQVSSVAPVRAVLENEDGNEVLASRILTRTYTSCAIAEKQLYCWGSNAAYKVGNGDSSDAPTPTRVANLPGEIVDVDMADDYVCAIVANLPGYTDNQLYCWGVTIGGAFTGQREGLYYTPTRITKAPRAPTQLGLLSSGSTCVISEGLPYCWGSDFSGELGNQPDLADSPTPAPASWVNQRPIDGLSIGADELGATCMHSDDKVFCWGDGYQGALGQGLSELEGLSARPVRVLGIPEGTPITKLIGGGGRYNCALQDEKLYCWGDLLGVLHTSQAQQIHLTDEAPVLDADVGQNHHLCLVAGQPGDADVRCYFNGTDMGTVLSGDVRAVAASSQHACAIVGKGVKCWGENHRGLLGNGTDQASWDEPVDVVGIELGATETLTRIAARISRTCVLTSQGNVWCWGEEQKAAVSLGTQGVVDLRGDGDNLCYLRSSSTGERDQLWCDGHNEQFQLASRAPLNVANKRTFQRIDPPELVPPFAAFASGGTTGRSAVCVLDAEDLKCWGSNAARQGGRGPEYWQATPAVVGSWMN